MSKSGGLLALVVVMVLLSEFTLSRYRAISRRTVAIVAGISSLVLYEHSTILQVQGARCSPSEEGDYGCSLKAR